MGQKTNPIGFRVGIIRGWESNWYESKSYASKLLEDKKLRSYIDNRLIKAGVSRIIINRTSKNTVITIHTSRPGMVIGKSGKEIAQLEQELKKISDAEVKVQISEIKRQPLEWVLNELELNVPADLAVQKWQEANSIKKEKSLCILYELILIMLQLHRILSMDPSVLKYGFPKVKN